MSKEQIKDSLWKCHGCYKIHFGNPLPKDWDIIFQSPVCPDCIQRCVDNNSLSIATDLNGGMYCDYGVDIMEDLETGQHVEYYHEKVVDALKVEIKRLTGLVYK